MAQGSRALDAHTTITFSAESLGAGADGLQLILDYVPFFYSSWGYGPIKLALYPAVNAKVVCSIGRVQMKERRTRRIDYEFITFSGSRTASPKYPITKLLYKEEVGGMMFTKEGEGVHPKVVYNADTGQFESNVEIYGAFVIAYDTDYYVLDYFPDVAVDNDLNGGVSIGTGTVLAFYNGAMAQITVEIRIEMPESNYGRYVELYSVTSTVIVNVDGRWEMPPSWPGSYKWPGRSIEGDEPEPENAMEEERVHEIGYIDSFGTTQVQSYAYGTPTWERPWTGSYSYKPKCSFKRESPPAGYEKAFLGVNWAEIYKRVWDKYGIEQES